MLQEDGVITCAGFFQHPNRGLIFGSIDNENKYPEAGNGAPKTENSCPEFS
jgi:hypothetical protein